MSGDSGYKIGLQATGVGLTVGALLWTGHAKAMEAVRQAREDRQQAIYDAYVARRLQIAEIDARRADELEAELRTTKAQLLSVLVEMGHLRQQLAVAKASR
ncbi:MAG: hypothetical protein KF849_15330 [Rhizobiaceae bacterium]|nr:hypothetical protein [Rhizobiaceae bacterium]